MIVIEPKNISMTVLNPAFKDTNLVVTIILLISKPRYQNCSEDITIKKAQKYIRQTHNIDPVSQLVMQDMGFPVGYI